MTQAAQLQDRGEGRCAISGALNFATVAEVWRGLAAGGLLRNARQVDLAGVTEGDSAGLALLLAWRAARRTDGADVTFQAVPERIVALARLTRAEALLRE